MGKKPRGMNSFTLRSKTVKSEGGSFLSANSTESNVRNSPSSSLNLPPINAQNSISNSSSLGGSGTGSISPSSHGIQREGNAPIGTSNIANTGNTGNVGTGIINSPMGNINSPSNPNGGFGSFAVQPAIRSSSIHRDGGAGQHGEYPPQVGIFNLQHPMMNSPIQPDYQSHLSMGSKGRMRVSKACDRCRTQKIKCSGTHPCGTCVKHKKECTYSTNFSTGGGVGGSTTSSNPREQLLFPQYKKQKLMVEPFGLPVVNRANDRDYISHLENRVQYLENLLSNNTMKTFKDPQIEEPENVELESVLIAPSSKWRWSRRHQNLLLIELCKSMYSNLSEESKQLVTLPRTQYFGWNMSGCHYVSSEELPKLPDISVDSEKYIDFFFQEINPLFAILHETVFREQVIAYDKLLREQLTLNKNVNDRDSKTNQTRLFSAKLFLVYALSIRFLEVQKPKGPSMEMLKIEEQLFKYAYKVVSILAFEWESFELIQSWLLITLYLRITHRQTSAHHALGQAITMTRAMGLGQDNPKLAVSTPYERLKAKRIFWCVYTFDRLFGLQTGRYCALRDEDVAREFPDFDFEKETQRDDWITIPAFALLQIARISNFVHTCVNDHPSLIKYQQINKELVILHDWFNSVGFRNDLLFNKGAALDAADEDGNSTRAISSMVKAQVKLHYYDLVLCIHGKVLFNYIGRRITSNGLKLEMVIDASRGIIEVLDKTNKAGLLYTPWYLVLLLLFNVGVNSIALINSGIFVEQCRTILKDTIKLLTILKKASVRNEHGKLVMKERFKMVKECVWALKMANRILTLRLEEDIRALNTIGTDHGSSDVNKQMFSQLGMSNEQGEGQSLPEKSKDEFNELLEKQLHRADEPQEMAANPAPMAGDSITPSSTASMDFSRGDPTYSGGPVPKVEPGEVDNLLSNLQWFDQWLDFNYDL
ncbi:hypothetical protein G9P44_002203 [Scheffersomyces stipitis]|nr:hypothetical protein G9P44_002203 [Scheffersomyces stipitis]